MVMKLRSFSFFIFQRMNFGFAHRLHLYSDYSILVSDYLAHGTLQVDISIFCSVEIILFISYEVLNNTLQDAINSNAVIGGSMEEVLCIYYTIELLHILEILHDTAIIHGDFKPDNLLIRYSR